MNSSHETSRTQEGNGIDGILTSLQKKSKEEVKRCRKQVRYHLVCVCVCQVYRFWFTWGLCLTSVKNIEQVR